MTARGDHDHHERGDPHRRAPALVDVVLGGQDGLVNSLGVLLGVAAAANDTRIVLAAGAATAIAESLSMAAVAYTTARARNELFASEEARERRHVRQVPSVERDEVRALYAEKGFRGELLDRIVDTITADEEVWVAVMMAEEHKLGPVPRREALRSAAIVGAAAFVGSLFPLAPYGVLAPRPASWAATVAAAVVLFAFGAYKARVTVGSPWKGGAVLAAIGLASALGGYLAGRLFGGAGV